MCSAWAFAIVWISSIVFMIFVNYPILIRMFGASDGINEAAATLFIMLGPITVLLTTALIVFCSLYYLFHVVSSVNRLMFKVAGT